MKTQWCLRRAISNRKAPTVLALSLQAMLTRRTAQRPRWPMGLTSSKTANGTRADPVAQAPNWISASKAAAAAESRGRKSAGDLGSLRRSCLRKQNASYRERCCRPPCVTRGGGSFPALPSAGTVTGLRRCRTVSDPIASVLGLALVLPREVRLPPWPTVVATARLLER